MSGAPGSLTTGLQRWLAVNIEPRVPWNSWFERRIRRQMSRIHWFERTLVERSNDSRWLFNFGDRQYSQNDEDGMIRELLRRLDIDGGFFVEIGASDGSENCTRALVEQGWSGLWIEGDPDKAAEARRVVGSRPVTVANEFVTRDNIVDILKSNDTPEDISLLVVDIDGNDWWVLDRLLDVYRAKAIVLEYNAAMRRRRWVMPYDPHHSWRHDRWHGASLASFAEMLTSHGMALVGTDTSGVNAFFVGQEHAATFPAVGEVETHYAPPLHLLPFGHPWRHDDAEMEDLDVSSARRVSITDVFPLASPSPTGWWDFVVEIDNRSGKTLRSSGSHPVHIAAWWTSADVDDADQEPERFRLIWPVPPRAKRPTFVRLRAPIEGESLEIDLVQEDVSWISRAHGKDALASLKVTF